MIDNKYKESLDYLFSQLPMFSRTGAPAYKPGLDTSLELANFFDNPQNKFKSIHIGGTNGKGSTSHMIASVLQAQGYKVGLYTSPHLVDFRERIKINGSMIPKERVIEFVDKWIKAEFHRSPSFFELTMIMAFNWFAEENVDYGVIEVGMGGRLDSTNIITPILSVITNISHDHNQFLGTTLKEIANEKAGIIKNKIPVVVGESQGETDETFIKKAKELSADIIFADKEKNSFDFSQTKLGWGVKSETLNFLVPLAGDYQKKNINTVISAIVQLKKNGVKIEDDAIKKGFESVNNSTGFAGRWMVLNESPLTIADTGHNIAGITYNVQQLKRLQDQDPDSQLRIVIGFVADKAIDEIIKVLPRNAIYYVTNAQIPRAMSAEKLLEKFNEEGLKAFKFENVEVAYKVAKKEASEKDIIFIGGSTFIVADFLASMPNY